jgi:hypothetical protein
MMKGEKHRERKRGETEDRAVKLNIFKAIEQGLNLGQWPSAFLNPY